MSKIPKQTLTEYLYPLLKGCYAYSYTAFWRAIPAYKAEIPQLGAFYEPASEPPFGSSIYPETPRPGKFTQVPGYSVGSFAGYVCFDGAGNLEGGGMGNRGGVDFAEITYKGTYTVYSIGMGVFTGIFTTLDPNADPPNFINHYFVMADDWDELRFIIQDTYLRQPVTSGTMRKIDKK